MCLANIPRIEDAVVMEARLRSAADLCNQQQLALATLLTMAADMIQHQHRLLMAEGWQPIETAPHGEPGHEVGSREPSEYFLARVRIPGIRKRVRMVRRMYQGDFVFADSDGETYYTAEMFSHWHPLPEGPTTCS